MLPNSQLFWVAHNNQNKEITIKSMKHKRLYGRRAQPAFSKKIGYFPLFLFFNLALILISSFSAMFPECNRRWVQPVCSPNSLLVGQQHSLHAWAKTDASNSQLKVAYGLPRLWGNQNLSKNCWSSTVFNVTEWKNKDI